MGGGPSSVRLKHRLDLDAHLELLANQPATGLERLVPGEAPLLAVDVRLGGEEGALTAERVAHLPVVLGLHRDGLGYSTDGEIAVDLPVVVAVVLHTRARERQLRVRVDLEEVRAAQMIVALLGARVDAGRLDRHARARLRRVLGDVQHAFELAEAALDLGHHQVTGLELDRRVRGVERPRARAGELDAVPGAGRSARCAVSYTHL